ncbi:PREDICTED: leucine-rich repeat-containing protein 1 isoform X2 [Nicrophorus vespilloides]|nr:PREDICTED: leucine-rich repeat-containing protein 1 isoform X2 [Nicrophorus vespilloides]
MNWLSCFACKQKTIENVKTLDFSRTSISEVPPEVFNFERTLENLYLDGNKIVELPRTLFQCEELRYLDISDNEIQLVPTLVSKLVNLQTLNISRNCLKHSNIPVNIHRCQKLTVLDMSSNTLDKLPEGLTSLVNLQELYLNDTYIEFLPANFGRLNNLKILELRDNNLSALPKSLRRLNALVRLDLSNNDFTDMPEVIASMVNLKELWLNGNCITSIILGIGNLLELQDFDASKNDIETVPSEIGRCTKLTSLILSHNLIKDFPPVLEGMKVLQTLKLDFNCLESLPYCIGDLESLEELDVQNNQISIIPNSFGFLRKLNYFIASHNFLTFLPSEIGSCVSLTILNLHNNMLKRLPDEIGHLQSLTSLGLIGNKLEFLPIPIANLPLLRALWLTQNQSHPLIPLQTEQLDHGQLVLTCFLLPQIHITNQDMHKVSPNEAVSLPKRHIAFSEPGLPREMLPKLNRAPTPYPKDFQRFQRSLNNQLRKNREGNAQPSLNLRMDPGQSLIKEAKVMKNEINGEFNDLKNYGTQTDFLPDAVPNYENDFYNVNKNAVIDPNMDYYSFNDKNSLEGSEQSKLSLELQEKCLMVTAKQPPPYHIAAAYSKNAKYFNKIEDIHPEYAEKRMEDSPIEKPKKFTQDLQKVSQNISIAQPVSMYTKGKSDVDNFFLRDLNKRYIDDDSYGPNENYEKMYADKKYLHNVNEQRVAKKMLVVLTPCCYVLGFTVTYNENGVFVSKVDENGNAFQKLFPGDKILMLDKIDLTKMEPWQAYKTVLIQGPETESFYITRY